MPNQNEFHRVAHRAALFVVLSCAIVMCCAARTETQAEMRRETMQITTGTGEHTFEIEIAESMEDKSRGLMFRRSLADNAGMLFPYQPAQEITMWMKNTYISLDMVFIRGDGVVHRIAAGTTPFSEEVVASKGDVSAVLEVRAGIAAKIGLKPGDRVRHAYFGKSSSLKR